MRKKFLSWLLAACMVAPCALALNACGGSGTKGLEYTKYGTGYAVIDIGKATDAEIVIPETYKKEPVVAIAKRAFEGCDFITSIDIPTSVKSIEEEAFSGCSGLKSLEIEHSLEKMERDILKGCTSIETLTLPNLGAFDDLPSLFGLYHDEAIPESVKVVVLTHATSVGDGAFNGCENLRAIVINDGVESIGNNAFKGCKGITDFGLPSSVTFIGDGAFYGCSSLEDLYYKGTMETWCNITFKSGLGIYGKGYSNPMEAAEHLYFYDANTGNPYEVTEVVIPDTVTEIGDRQFEGIKNLESIVIPSSVTKIGEYAFSGCDALTDVYYTGSQIEWLTVKGQLQLIDEDITIHYNFTPAA